MFSIISSLFGYIDGGSGSLIFQALLAGLFAAAFSFKSAVVRVRAMIKPKRTDVS